MEQTKPTKPTKPAESTQPARPRHPNQYTKKLTEPTSAPPARPRHPNQYTKKPTEPAPAQAARPRHPNQYTKKPTEPAPAQAARPRHPNQYTKKPTQPAPAQPARPRPVGQAAPPPEVPRTRVNDTTGGFSILSTALLVKDFIDTTYQTDPDTPLANSLVSTVLYHNLLNYLKAVTDLPSVPYSITLPNPHLYQTEPGVLTIPLWRQNEFSGSHLPTWQLTKDFLRDFKPCIDAADEIFKSFCPKEYAHMRKYHNHLIHEYRLIEMTVAGATKGVVIEGGFRSPFESMRITVNAGVETKLVREAGVGAYKNAWIVVLFLGQWIDGGMEFGVQDVKDGKLENVEKVEKVEIEGGDAWILSGEKKRGCVYGLDEGFIGERVMVEFFVPVVRWTGRKE